jgi:ubiquinone/menaquinone biosynthesis C-methylase UbiE
LALKIFKGKSPLFNFKSLDFSKLKLLDLGFGDGRDLQLFVDLGFQTYGCEPEREIVSHTRNKHISPNLILKVGKNTEIPFEDNYFDFIYASASIYYLSNLDLSIEDALKESNRCLKKGGYLIFTATTPKNHYIESAEKISKNIYKLQDEYFNQRLGQLIHVYKDEKEISNDLTRLGFSHDSFVGKFSVDWLGVHESLFIVVSKKNS